ncbi:hypothetical protein K435DRAFT_834199 [Dendrothele bispora CBS 962.96]|uniref:Uncharacterized protein n=1 Tax=Dendrothele bispora (strain CBS 962.96) TaxID=1314807 RepID=A0A4S8MTI4_DENBC|nr:hypothetical protein K435DRAFT_834199 [Dendrothele bispora CBS 962.96]
MSKADLTPLDTTQETLPSPTTSMLSPTWAPPKSPLPPHRLAKLANALGVSTPMPAAHNYASPTSPAFNQNSLTTPDVFRRSPSPSAASSFSSYQPSTSKYLLHVIPPLHLPHESDLSETSVLTPPPSSASGYHTQFRRGTLAPVHSTLQSQLVAIAKEYALPSTAGLVLYLVSNPNSSSQSVSDDVLDEPGPRLSEEIWKHLWTRVWKAEREEGMNGLIGLGMGLGTQSTPHLLQEGSNGNGSQLRSFLSNNRKDPNNVAPYPSPSSPSSASVSRSNSRTTAPSLNSPTDTPNTSVPEDDLVRANSLDLPGLRSPSIIPILAKVEFDIDKKKAGWYVPWMRSRSLNHAKRIRNRQPVADDTSESGEGSDRKPPISLRLRAQTASPVSFLSSSSDLVHPADELNAEYARLQDENNEDEDEDEDEEDEMNNDDDDDETARVASTGKDPLADVFGSDADTWADMRDLAGTKRRTNDPNVVDLALTGGDLADLPEPGEDEEQLPGDNELDEVQGIIDKMTGSHGTQESSGGIHRSHVPPPLVLHPPNSTGNELDVPSSLPSASCASSDSRTSTYLPYLKGTPSSGSPVVAQETNQAAESLGDDEDDLKPKRTPQDSEKRVGGVFDDLDLGLEPSVSEDFDDGEIPNDHRKSQYILKAQLDEIERNLNQLSPRALKIDLEDEPERSPVSLNSPFLGVPMKRNEDVFPPTPMRSGFDTNVEANSTDAPRQWPAVPYSQLNEEAMPGSSNVSASTGPSSSPPRLAVNGVTTAAPKSFVVKSNSEISAETKQRKRALEEDLGYPLLNSRQEPTESPIIPLSPDPFGRFPSASHTPEPGTSRSGSRQSNRDMIEPIKAPNRQFPLESSPNPKTSRFSTDSIKDAPEDKKTGSRTTILSTKGIRKLWRRSNNKSMSNISLSTNAEKVSVPPPKTSMDSLNPPPTPSLSTGRISPTRPPRPSEENMDIPDIPEQMAIPLHPTSGRPAPMPIIAAQMQQGRSKSALDHLHFDQESPYPTARRSPVPPPIPKEPYVPGDSHRTSVRKSILKWKAAASIGNKSEITNANTSPEGTMPNGATRSRRPSVASFASSRQSQTSPPPSIPPSPRIPEQFLKNGFNSGNGQHLRTGSHQTHLTSSSMDSRVDSLASSAPHTQSSTTTVRSSSPLGSAKSRESEEGSDARPSIDESQFEIVSPRMGAQQLSYPYHGLDVPS